MPCNIILTLYYSFILEYPLITFANRATASLWSFQINKTYYTFTILFIIH